MAEKDWQADIERLRERERKARAVLGVSEEADAAAIRQAYRRASLAHHPDANPQDKGAAERFRLIHCAYRFLSRGEACDELGRVGVSSEGTTDEKHQRDSAWGYWCWFREEFFDGFL